MLLQVTGCVTRTAPGAGAELTLSLSPSSPLPRFHSNVLDPPNPAAAPKYRQLRLANSQVVRNIVDVPGAFDYLIACGWHSTVVEYVACKYLVPNAKGSS